MSRDERSGLARVFFKNVMGLARTSLDSVPSVPSVLKIMSAKQEDAKPKSVTFYQK